MTNTNSELWMLKITDLCGTTFAIYGSEELLTIFVDEWSAAIEDIAHDLDRVVLKIDGHCDSADRAPVRFTICASKIASVFVTRLSY